MAWKLFFVVVLTISSCISQSICQSNAEVKTEDGVAIDCVEKLASCQAFLDSSTPPSPLCCSPLKQMVSNDTDCLCHFFTDADLFRSLNITQPQALQIPNACGVKVDVSVCKASSSSNSTENAASEIPHLYGMSIVSVIISAFFG